MKWKGPYSEHAYCPDCWASFEFFAPRGFDENDPIRCINCSGTRTRIYDMGDFNGDQLREYEKKARLQAQEDAKKEGQGEN